MRVELILLVATLAAISGCARRGPEPIALTLYYEIVCPSCPESAKSEALANQVLWLGRIHDHVTARAIDVMHGSGLSELAAEAADRNVDLTALPLPILFVGSDVHSGFDAIERTLEAW